MKQFIENIKEGADVICVGILFTVGPLLLAYFVR